MVAEVWTADGSYVTEVNTDAAGAYQVSVAPGDYRVHFSTIVKPAFVAEWSGDVLFESDASAVTVADGGSAVADAALAGGLPAPLYIVPGTCVPPGVLAGVLGKRPSSITVLGGPTTVSPAAEDLTPC